MTQSAKMAAHIYNVSRGVALLGNNCLLFRRCNSVVFHCKRHVRAVRRKPGSVISPDGERNALIKSNRSAELNQKLSDKGAKESNGFPKHPTKRESLRESEISAHLKIKLGGLRYEKATGGDDRLAKVASIARSRTFREKERKVLLEGRRLISDALAAGASPQMVFFSRLERLQELPLKNLQQAKLIKVKHEDMKTWSDLVTPQGVIAIFSKPDASCLAFPKDVRLQSVPLFLICDNMRDAGNLGTVLRCAAAAGCERVLLTKGCVDAWEPKVLRAAMGAHFRLPVFPSLDWDDIPAHLPKDAVVHVAENCNSATWWSEPAAGSEEYDESDSGEESDDERSFPHMEPRVYGESWAQGNTALVIGGERLGVSLEVLRFVEKTQGNRLYVPMAPGVSSLSSAMTASVLLFEGRRQLLELARKTRQRSKTRH